MIHHQLRQQCPPKPSLSIAALIPGFSWLLFYQVVSMIAKEEWRNVEKPHHTLAVSPSWCWTSFADSWVSFFFFLLFFNQVFGAFLLILDWWTEVRQETQESRDWGKTCSKELQPRVELVTAAMRSCTQIPLFNRASPNGSSRPIPDLALVLCFHWQRTGSRC